MGGTPIIFRFHISLRQHILDINSVDFCLLIATFVMSEQTNTSVIGGNQILPP